MFVYVWQEAIRPMLWGMQTITVRWWDLEIRLSVPDVRQGQAEFWMPLQVWVPQASFIFDTIHSPRLGGDLHGCQAAREHHGCHHQPPFRSLVTGLTFVIDVQAHSIEVGAKLGPCLLFFLAKVHATSYFLDLRVWMKVFPNTKVWQSELSETEFLSHMVDPRVGARVCWPDFWRQGKPLKSHRFDRMCVTESSGNEATFPDVQGQELDCTCGERGFSLRCLRLLSVSEVLLSPPVGVLLPARSWKNGSGSWLTADGSFSRHPSIRRGHEAKGQLHTLKAL